MSTITHLIGAVGSVLIPYQVASTFHSSSIENLNTIGTSNLDVQESIELKLDPLEHALIMVESTGNDSAYGDRHLKGNEAVGCLQIRPVMVREVNRILKLQKKDTKYTLRDRWSRKKSIEMFRVWKNFHHKNDPNEVVIRNWNGGPTGYLKPTTVNHWKKVKKELSKL